MKLINNTFFLLLIFVTIVCSAQEQMIEKITIKGTKKTKVNELKKILSFKENTVLDSIQLNENLIRLKRLPAISHAYYEVVRLPAGQRPYEKNAAYRQKAARGHQGFRGQQSSQYAGFQRLHSYGL